MSASQNIQVMFILHLCYDVICLTLHFSYLPTLLQSEINEKKMNLIIYHNNNYFIFLIFLDYIFFPLHILFIFAHRILLLLSFLKTFLRLNSNVALTQQFFREGRWRR